MPSHTTATAVRVPYNDLHCELIIIAPYESAWAREFQREHESIVRAVGAEQYQIEHVGSTSVSGMAAKPTIDIGIAIDDMMSYQSLIYGLESLGYLHYPEYRQWLPEIGLFIKRDNVGRRSHHALVVKACSQVWDDYLDFRDYLRAQPEVALAYAQLKRAAASRHPHDRMGYNTEKTEFITKCLREYRETKKSVCH